MQRWCRSSFSPWAMGYRKGICGCTSDLFVGLAQSAPARTLRAEPMNPSGCLCSRIIEAMERLSALRGRQAPTDEELARSNGECLGQLGEEGRVELRGSIEEQAPVQCQRHGRR